MQPNLTSTPDKLLIVAPAWVGDMVMAQTLFKLLRQKRPQSSIDVLAPAWSAPLLACMPEINHAWISPFGHGELRLRERYQLGVNLRQMDYTQAIVLPNSLKSALVPWFAKIPCRTGWRGEWRYGLLNDVRRLDKTALPLMIQRFMALGLPPGQPLPAPSLPELVVPKDKIETTLSRLELNLEPQRPVLALCPGAEYGPAKRWPAAHFAAVARYYAVQGWQVWLLGSAKEQSITHEIQQQTGGACQDLAGKTSLAEAIYLLAVADMVVTNDSGLMHIAAALQRPMVVIYGSSSPQFTPPLTKKVKILSLDLSCSPCFKRECPLQHLRCLQDLSPERVKQAVAELLSQ